MIDLKHTLTPEALLPGIERMWEVSAAKISAIERDFEPARGAPVFTVEGRYTARGWTDWTQGFRFGSALLQFDATEDRSFLELGRRKTLAHMASHVTHTGVHDHGFNNVSTYGALRRLMNEGRIPESSWERAFYELALKASGAVQAARWTELAEGYGYVYSFNGPHSLFADTIRSMRALALAHRLGHVLMGEHDARISLLERMVRHLRTTARFNVYYGEGRDGYDVPGRVAHESIFNLKDGSYRCPSTQQGYAPYTTWTRGLSWIMLGFAEQLEFLDTLSDEEPAPPEGWEGLVALLRRAARLTCDFYIEETPACGVPYWDTGAPGLIHLGDYRSRPADPFNPYEPVDSSAAAVAAQGLLRLGHYLDGHGADGARYRAAGLRVLATLLEAPYLSRDAAHHGLLLHAVYHWPNRWDHVPPGRRVACCEATMWGDYHLRELALYVQRLARGETYYTFFG